MVFKKIATINLLMFTVCSAVFAGSMSRCEAKIRFDELKAGWWNEVRDEARFSSDPYAYWDGEMGLEIIAMEIWAFAFVMEEIEQGNILFIVPAEKITHLSVDGLSTAERGEAWIRWWQDARQNPDYNIYLLEKPDEKREMTALGAIYTGMPERVLYEIYDPIHIVEYNEDDNEEWVTFNDWTTNDWTTDEAGDVVTFHLKDNKVISWAR
ncbi:MAG: hypothetical protein ABID09_01495 [Candidatus Omnitrophota bacterium]